MILRHSLQGDHQPVIKIDHQKLKIRNLRAKLKNLLLKDACTKLCKRQKIVTKIQQIMRQKQQQRSIVKKLSHFKTQSSYLRTPEIRWSIKKQNSQKLYITSKNTQNAIGIFGSLSVTQIQQVKEDMIYYLGQQIIQKFQQFLKVSNYHQKKPIFSLKNLKTKTSWQQVCEKVDQQKFKHSNQNNNIKQSVIQSFKTNNPLCQTPYEKQSQFISKRDNRSRWWFSQNHQPFGINTSQKFLCQSKFQAYYLGNRQNFLINRKQVQKQQEIHQALTKFKINKKIQNAKLKINKNKKQQMRELHMKNLQNSIKTDKIREKVKKNNIIFGQIVDLNQQLRDLLIEKAVNVKKTLNSIQIISNKQQIYYGQK